jgi:hypothetical protein
MASNGQIFGWTAAVIAVVYTAVNGLDYFLVGVGYGILCGMFLVICNILYQKSKNSEDRSSSVAVSQRPLQLPPRIRQKDQIGPRIVSITDRDGKQYPVPPQHPPNPPMGSPPTGKTGPALREIDYSRAECVICLSPASFFCEKCGQTYCRKHVAEANYLCPDCHVRLTPIRRVR